MNPNTPATNRVPLKAPALRVEDPPPDVDGYQAGEADRPGADTAAVGKLGRRHDQRCRAPDDPREHMRLGRAPQHRADVGEKRRDCQDDSDCAQDFLEIRDRGHIVFQTRAKWLAPLDRAVFERVAGRGADPDLAGTPEQSANKLARIKSRGFYGLVTACQ